MSNVALRFYDDGVQDKFSKIAVWTPIWPKYGNDGRFTTDDENKSALVDHNEGFYEYSKDSTNERKTNYNFKDSNLTVSFWLAFNEEFCNEDISILQNKFIFYISDTENMSYDIPFTDNDWHHYAIVRIKDGIRMYVDGSLVSGITTTSYIDFDTTSYVYVGQPMKYCYGDTFLLDDMYIFEAALWNTATFTVPDKYMNSDAYYRIFNSVKDDPNIQNNFYSQSSGSVEFISS